MDPKQVVVTAGAKGGLFAVLAALLEPGDELIHPRPCYPAYPKMASRLGARPIAVAEDAGSFADWASSVAEKITAQTRAVILATPSNPSGSTLTGKDAAELVDICRRKNIRLICDEAYGDFRFRNADDDLAADFDPSRETVIQIRSVSKSWALCGWRVGWVVADPVFAARVASCHASFLNPASGPAQEALLALPDIPENYLSDAREVVAGRITDVRRSLEAVGLEPKSPGGGFYLWFDIGHITSASVTATRWCRDLAETEGVGLWPGEDFQGPDYVRLSVTGPSDASWQQSLDQLVSALG